MRFFYACVIFFFSMIAPGRLFLPFEQRRSALFVTGLFLEVRKSVPSITRGKQVSRVGGRWSSCLVVWYSWYSGGIWHVKYGSFVLFFDTPISDLCGMAVINSRCRLVDVCGCGDYTTLVDFVFFWSSIAGMSVGILHQCVARPISLSCCGGRMEPSHGNSWTDLSNAISMWR